jgi:midasin
MITSTVALLQDVIDCFLAYTQSPEKLISAAITVGALFGFNKDKVEYICSSMKPSIEVSETHITIGRSTLPKMTPSEKYDPTQHCAFTRHALVLLEQLAVCVHHSEPVLLVGDTGTGKTSAVQHLARLTGHKLTVLNLSQQSDSSDLLGGFQPVNVSRVVGRVKDHFLDLFHCTFSVVQNIRFLRHIQDSYVKNDWKTILRLMHHCFLSAKKRAGSCGRLKSQWHAFGLELERLTMKLQEARTSFAFDFVEGKVVEAVKKGGWILLDEINLATSETLDCLSGLLEEGRESVVLLEKGELKPVTRHSEFRLFACMNPATDIGKQDLPVGIRNRFTEIFVNDMTDPNDLLLLVSEYLQSFTLTSEQLSKVVSLYGALRECAERELVDIAGRKPHYKFIFLYLSFCL